MKRTTYRQRRIGAQFAIAAAAAGVIALGAAATPPDPPRYVLIDLQTLGGEFSQALGMNNSGAVVGWSTTTADPTDNPHGFIWQDGVMQDLGSLGGIWTEARSVNDDNQVVGVSMINTGDGRHGFFERHGVLWYDGVLFDLNDQVITLPDGQPPTFFDGLEVCTAPIRLVVEANRINNDGYIVGCGLLYGDDNMHGIVLIPRDPFFLTEPEYYWADLGTLKGAPDCFAYCINDAGLVVGTSGQQAFIHDTEIEPLEFYADESVARSVNNFGTVVGWRGENEMVSIACMWQDGHCFDLGFGGEISEAVDIGDNGLIVGWAAENMGQPARAMLWEGCLPVELNVVTSRPLSQQTFQWDILARATAIDSSGRIAGIGRSESGTPRAFLLLPIGLEDPDENSNLRAR